MKEISIHEAKLNYIKDVYKELIEDLTEKLEDIETGNSYICEHDSYELESEFKKAYNLKVSHINIDNEDTDINLSYSICNKNKYNEAQGLAPALRNHKTVVVDGKNRWQADSSPMYYNIKESERKYWQTEKTLLPEN